MATATTTSSANALRWNGSPGHYEVYYVSLTDRASGCGLWIRFTMVAPQPDTGEAATCSLWFMAMDPADPSRNAGRKGSWPVSELVAHADPFRLEIADAFLAEDGMSGGFEDVRWDLRWQPTLRPYRHVDAKLEAARIAKTVLVLPHPDLSISGTVEWGGRTLELDGARGGQAHLWGSKHASRWAWAHCNDFETLSGEPVAEAFLDGVSVYVPRLGREIGPSTPIVARLLGEDFEATGPLQLLGADSVFALTTWQFEVRDGARRVIGEVDARREDLVGVTYHDPDGDLAYCYNSEVATMRLRIFDRTRAHFGGWTLRETLVAPGRAHFEYAQREPVQDVPLHVT
jgi:hypothetical protein